MMLVIAMPCFGLIVTALRKSLRVQIPTFLLIVTLGILPTRLAGAEFKMSIVVNEATSWGLAGQRFADAIKYRTQGRVQIKNYFNGQIFAGKQTTEFELLQQGAADFAIGSIFNWTPQVKELSLFGLPFMFPSYTALDAVEAGEPGARGNPMSALGQKQTSAHVRVMSALPPIADIGTQPRNVRFVPKADVAAVARQPGMAPSCHNFVA
jgi:hypothetical protein